MKKTILTIVAGFILIGAGTARAQFFPQKFQAPVLPVTRAASILGNRCIGGPLFTSAAAPAAESVTVSNKTGAPATIHLGFIASSCYKVSNFSSFCAPEQGNASICTFSLANNGTQVLNFTNTTCEASFAIAINQDPWQGCANTFAELTLYDYWSFNNTYNDGYDISLVNGFSVPAKLIPSGQPTVTVTSASNNQQNVAVYPLGCSSCSSTTGAPPSCNFNDNAACKSNVSLYPCQEQPQSGVNSSYTVEFD